MQILPPRLHGVASGLGLCCAVRHGFVGAGSREEGLQSVGPGSVRPVPPDRKSSADTLTSAALCDKHIDCAVQGGMGLLGQAAGRRDCSAVAQAV